MSNNVFQINQDKEPYTYYIDGDDLAVSDKLQELQIGFLMGEPTVCIGGYGVHYKREDLAQMLWAAAYLLDSEERYRKDKYVGKDYE